MSLALQKAPRTRGWYFKTALLYVFLVLIGLYIWRDRDVIARSFELVVEVPLGNFLLSLLLMLITFAMAAGAYYNLSLKKINYTEILVVEFAAATINRLFPAGFGSMGAHGLYLHNRKHTSVQAGTVVTANNTLGFLAHISLLLIGLIAFPQAMNDIAWPSVPLPYLLSGVALAVVGLWLVVSRKLLKGTHETVVATLRQYKAKPRKIFYAAVFLAALTLLNYAVFMLASAAFGVNLPLVIGFLIYSTGVLVGSATPTPGGLVGVEAGLVAGLLAYGVDDATALAATLVFRLVTFWLPLVPGLFALVYARRKAFF